MNKQESPGVLTYLYLVCENDLYELEPSHDHWLQATIQENSVLLSIIIIIIDCLNVIPHVNLNLL